jgi:hypothetical protein
MALNIKRGAVIGAITGAAVLAVGGVAVGIAQAASPAAGAAATMSAAAPGTAGAAARSKTEAAIITGDYDVSMGLMNDQGEGLGTGVKAHTTYYVPTIHLDFQGFKSTVMTFRVGYTGDGPVVATYTIPAPGKFVDCTASGTAASPHIQCVTR